jgi:hypothetical protein
MRIRQIIIESLKMPFTDFKAFLVVYLLMFSCEILSYILRLLPVDDYYLGWFILKTVVSLMMLGISMNIVQKVVFGKSLHFNIKHHLVEGFNEYVLTLYYILIPSLLSILLLGPTGLYFNVIHVYEYILDMDINVASSTVMELLHFLPESMNINLYHSIQLHLLITLFLFVLFTSFSYIGRILMFKFGSLKVACDLRIILRVVRKMGYGHFMKFVLIFTLIVVVVVNFLIYLDIFIDDVFISAFFEVFLLLFSSNSFYKLFFNAAIELFKKSE